MLMKRKNAAYYHHALGELIKKKYMLLIGKFDKNLKYRVVCQSLRLKTDNIILCQPNIVVNQGIISEARTWHNQRQTCHLISIENTIIFQSGTLKII